MSINLNKSSIFEKYIERLTYNNIIIKGYIDCIDQDIIYEFKCTNYITPEHILQLALYSYLINDSNKKYKLYNIYTDECIEIIVSDDVAVVNSYELSSLFREYLDISLVIFVSDVLIF